MAANNVVVACLFLGVLLVAHGVQVSSTSINAVPETANTIQIDCGSACTERCKSSGRPNLCKRACGSCCDKCKCVPPGTYGNYDACSCYANLTTRHNKPKCP